MAKPQRKLTALQIEVELRNDIAAFQHDPAGFVWYAFPWGQPGPLLHQRPRKWFLKLCERVRVKLLANQGRPIDAWEVVQQAAASGRGTGKSAGIAMLILWAMSTFEKTRGKVTANTGDQLRTTTWPELIKWHALMINRHWFECTATAIFHVLDEKNWRVDAATWSETNLEAFQGLHNLGRRLILAFDEASGIANKVKEVTEGSLIGEGTEVIWLAFGNPTRSKGWFRECFTRERELWDSVTIDSRDVEGVNLARVERWRRLYGEASQFFRIHVMGQFCEADANQLISGDWLAEARQRGAEFPLTGDGSLPKLRVSVDVADGGEDDTVVTVGRHWHAAVEGLCQRVFSFLPGVAPVEAADAAERMFLEWGGVKSTDDFVVDGLGVGAGTVGTLMKRGYNVIRYCGGEASSNPKRWRCRRVQSYMVTRDALRNGSLLLRSNFCEDQEAWDEFDAQVTSVKSKPGTERLEDLVTREEMRRDGLKSPDRADSLVMQFATQAPNAQADASVRLQVVTSPSRLLEGMYGR